MVRLKNRYLLVQILSPSASGKTSPTRTDSDSVSSLLLTSPSTLQHHLPTPDEVTPSILVRLIRAQILSLFGDYGAGVASAGLAVKYWSNATSTLILRCSRASVRMVWAAVTFIRTLGTNRAVVMQVVRVSGTVKKCEEEAISRARAICGKVKGLSAVQEAGMDLGDQSRSREAEDEELNSHHPDVDIAMAEGNGIDEDDSDDDG